MVGVVLHVEPHLLFSDPYFAQVLAGIGDQLAGQRAGMMLWLGSRTKQETLDHILWMSFLDGVIVSASTLEDPLVDGLLASSLPTVLLGHRRADESASYVDIDNVAAADGITTHLLSLGRTRIGHITGSRGTVAGEDRLTGYRRPWGAPASRPRSSSSTATSTRHPELQGRPTARAAGSTRSSAGTMRWRRVRWRRSGRRPASARGCGPGGVRRPRVRGRARSTPDDGSPGGAAAGQRPPGHSWGSWKTRRRDRAA